MKELLSDRVLNMAESATLAMAQKARDYKAKGIDIISLSLGEPDFKTPQHICDGAIADIQTGKYFSYPPVPGYPDLREAIAEKLRTENGIASAAAANVVVSNGAKQSLANLALALLNPGDEVIIFAPYWVTYPEQVTLVGGKPVIVGAGADKEFKVTADQVAAAITPKTKAILFSSPSNPTGAVFSKAELQAIADVVLQHEDLLVIADEIYEYINYTDEQNFSIASLPGMAERTVVVNGYAKGFAMTGWRVGYIHAPAKVAKAVTKIQGQLTSANCSIAQRAAYTATTSDLGPTHDMAQAYKNRRDLVLGLLREIPGFHCPTPEGAFYVFPEVKELFGKAAGDRKIENADDLSMYLLDEAHVSTVAGTGFGAPECIRISYAASDDQLREALSRIKAAVEKLA